jgi:hypothetical protein
MSLFPAGRHSLGVRGTPALTELGHPLTSSARSCLRQGPHLPGHTPSRVAAISPKTLNRYGRVLSRP